MRIKLFFETGKTRGRFALRLKVLFGKGAGSIGGRTFFFAINSGSRDWLKTYRQIERPYVEIGFTKNANIVPYLYH